MAAAAPRRSPSVVACSAGGEGTGMESSSSDSPDAPTRAKQYTDELIEMGMKMTLIRRNVAGPKNDLKALKLYQVGELTAVEVPYI